MEILFLFYYVFVGLFFAFHTKLQYLDEDGNNLVAELNPFILFFIYILILLFHPLIILYLLSMRN